MMLLAHSVREAGYKVVLTGEGNSRRGLRRLRPLPRGEGAAFHGAPRSRAGVVASSSGSIPYLQHSPAAGRAFTQRFFSEGLDEIGEPWFAHLPRMTTARRALQFLRPEWHDKAMAWDARAALRATLPEAIARWPALGRDQYVEAHTLMSGYLLSSQGDRMAMAASIEARFPSSTIGSSSSPIACRRSTSCAAWPRSTSSRSPWPPSCRRRSPTQQAALPCARQRELLRRRQTARLRGRTAEPEGHRRRGRVRRGIGRRLMEKCRSGRAVGFGDNIAFVGVLSTMLLHRQFIAPRRRPARDRALSMLLHEAFEATCERLPGKTAIVCGRERVSYGELARASPRWPRCCTSAASNAATASRCSSRAVSSSRWRCTPCSASAPYSCRCRRSPRPTNWPTSSSTRVARPCSRRPICAPWDDALQRSPA